MKKILIILLSLAMAFSFAGCVEKTTPVDNGDDPNNGNNTDNPIDDPVEDDGDPFTVSLTLNGMRYVPSEEVTVQWTATDGSGIYGPVSLNANGIAQMSGLDGDYMVTLSVTPEGYTYNPNIYLATNDNKETKIELIPIVEYTGTGSDRYKDAVQLSQLGAYRLNFTQAGQEYFCQYTPKQSGVFSIESIVDITANEINPKLDVYIGTSAWLSDRPTLTYDDGGVSSVYTKNFKYEVTIANTGIGNSYFFVVKCESRISYPVNVDFIITRDGEFEYSESSYELVVPEENFYDENGNLKVTPEYQGYTWVWFGLDDTPNGVLDASRVAYYDPQTGGDGYYHLLNADGTVSDTVLYAKIAAPILVGTDLSFQNDLVRVRFGGKDYTLLIRGYDGLVSSGYSAAADYEGFVSYIDCVNSDGVCAVTPELKNFIQAYCCQNQLFLDGRGTAEASGYNSTDDNQWLCFCGYYTNNG